MNHLTYLRTFLAVYRSGSVTAAAGQLALTQPAASGHVKALETALRRKLFHRAGRGISPTETAHALARAIAPHLDGLEAAFEAVRLTADSLAGPLTLGGPAEFMTAKVIPALAGLGREGITLHLRFGLTQDLITALAASELDLAVATLRINHPAVGYQPLYVEDFVLVGSPGWARRLAEDPGPDAWAALPWLSYAEGLPIIRRYCRQILGKDLDITPSLIVPDLRGLLAACAAGAGVTVLPRYLCRKDMEQGDCVALLHPAQPPVNQLYLAWNKTSLRHPRIQAVRARLLAAAGSW